MSWWAWFLLAVYLFGYAITFRRIAGQWAWYYAANGLRRRSQPTGEQWFGAVFAASFLSLVWPISLLVAHGIESSRTASGFSTHHGTCVSGSTKEAGIR